MLLESQISSLEELNLSNNSVDSEDASNLINALVGNTKLKTIDLKNNGWITNEKGVFCNSHVTVRASQT